MTLLYLKQNGTTFEVRLSTDAALNAWQGRVLLPADLAVRSVVYGGSIGDVWQTPPTFSGTNIDFAGGRTTAFNGDGLLFRFTAMPKDPGGPVPSELISFEPARTAVYAADGSGTGVPAVLQPLTINTKDLLSVTTGASALSDTMPPESFVITTLQEPAVFDGKLAAIFSATDAGTGIDRYEAQEDTPHGTVGWHAAASPYLVDPEATTLSIRAIDRNGNIRTESIVLQKGLSGGSIAAIGGAFILLALAAAYFTNKWRKKRSR